MKNILFYGFILALFGMQVSCDKITQPYIIITDLDTSLFPGNFYDYEAPTFGNNANTLRNVLIEDLTGHLCSYCPGAAVKAATIAEDNPGRVFIAAIHASGNVTGSSAFQVPKTTGNKFTRDFRTDEGRAIAKYLSEIQGSLSNPIGTVNRFTKENGEIAHNHALWGPLTDDVLATNLEVNIEAKSNYFPGTRGLYIHTEAEFLADKDGEYSIVIYAIQNLIIDWQLVGAVEDEFYKHHDVHIGNVFAGEALGRIVASGSITQGAKFQNDFSYVVPDGLTSDDMHFLIYVYDKGSDEILQVIKHVF